MPSNNSLKMVIAFGNYLRPDVTFYDIISMNPFIWLFDFAEQIK